MSQRPRTPTLLGIPFDAASSFERGAALGPRAIRDALGRESSNRWSEDGTDMGAPGVIEDAGDVEVPDDVTAANLLAPIERAVGRLLDAGQAPDVVELNPRNDPSPRTALVGAKFVKELAAAIRRGHHP